MGICLRTRRTITTIKVTCNRNGMDWIVIFMGSLDDLCKAGACVEVLRVCSDGMGLVGMGGDGCGWLRGG